MNRRDFLRSTGIVSASLAFAKAGRFFATDTAADHWRTFEVTTRVEILKTSGTTRIWLPTPLISQSPFQKTLSTTFHAEGGTAKTTENNPDALGIIVAEFPSGVRPVLTLTSRSISGVSTSGRFPGHCELVQGRNPATPSSSHTQPDAAKRAEAI